MNNTNVKNQQSDNDNDDYGRLVKAFKSNPQDHKTVTQLIRSLNRSGKYRQSIKILNRITTSPDFENHPELFRDIVIKCTIRTYTGRANKELDDSNIQQALAIFEEMANKPFLFNKQKEDQTTVTELNNINQNNIIIKKIVYKHLLSLLVKRKNLKQAVELLSDKNCIVDYPLATEIMKNFAISDRSKQLTNLNRHIVLVKKLLKMTGKEVNQDKIINDSIYTNTLYPINPWREKCLSYCNLDEMKLWIHVSGIEHMHNAQAKGQGIILLSSHLSTGRSLNLLLTRMGVKINALEAKDRMGQFDVYTTENMNVFELGEEADFPLRELYMIQKLLKKGEIVNLSGDGFRGKTGVATNFLGRTRNFKTSFAELAVNTDSVALPVFGTAHQTGNIELQINPPLKMPDKKLSRGEQVKFLISQYSNLLEKIWLNYPGSIAWEQLNYFFTLPQVNEP